MKNENKEIRTPSIVEAVIVAFSLFICIIGGYILMKFPITLMLIASAFFAGLMSLRIGFRWKDIESAIVKHLKGALPALFIMFTVGMVISSLIFSGSIPMIIYYGLKIIRPNFFLPCCFLICAVMSIATGTSWGAAGTAGLGLLGIAIGLGFPLPVTIGAIVAGSIIGDKCSPLSDSSNLAAMSTGVNIYALIRSMMWTTLPAAGIAFIFYVIYGFNLSATHGGSGTSESLTLMMSQLDSIYNWNVFLLLIPFLIIIVSALLKYPAVPAMMTASVVAVIIGVFYQGFGLTDGVNAMATGFKLSMTAPSGFDAATATPDIIKLLERGGISSMFNTVLIVFCAYSYSGIASEGGYFDVLMGLFVNKLNSRGSTVLASVLVGIFFTIVGGSSYIPIMMVGILFKKLYLKQNLDLTNLGRTSEDTGTMIISVVPWSTSGTYYYSIFGVSALSYGPYVLLPILCPLFAILYGFTGIGMKHIAPEEAQRQLEALE